MQRVLEPELMEDEAQAQAYAQADFDAPNAAFVDGLLAAFPDLPRRGVAVDLGCGPADILLRLARRLPGWRLHGLDGAEAMLAPGRAAVDAAGLGERVHLHRARLPALPPAVGPAALCLSNSLLHHLPDPQLLWRAVRALGAPGAAVYVADLARPGSLPAAEALVEQYAAGEPAVLRRDFLASLCAAFRVEEVREQLDDAGLGALRVEACSDRHLRVFGRLPPR
jgi:trans-aconitate methyltransferase